MPLSSLSASSSLLKSKKVLLWVGIWLKKFRPAIGPRSIEVVVCRVTDVEPVAAPGLKVGVEAGTDT